MADKDIFAPPTDSELKMFAPPSQDELNLNRTPASNQRTQYTPLQTLATSSLSGITGGFADEIEAGLKNPMGGGKSLLGLLGMDTSNDSDVQAYRKEQQALDQMYKQSAEDNPYTNVGGNILGGLVPGIGVSKLVGGVAKGASLLSKMGNAAEAGGLLGAVQGAGTSEADLSKGEVGQLAKDTVLGGGLGAGLGAGLQAVGTGAIKAGKSLINEIGNFTEANLPIQSLKAGMRGINVNDLDTQYGRLEDVANKIGLGHNELMGKLSGSFTKLKNAMKSDKNDLINLKPLYEEFKADVEKVRTNFPNPELESDSKRMLDVLANEFEGKQVTKDIRMTPYTPSVEKAIQAKPGARELLEKEATLAKEQARQLGESLDTQIVESSDDQGNKLLTLLKTKQEPIQTEVPNIKDGELIKVKRSFENSPKGRQKAEEAVAKLNSKAKFENNISNYDIVHDPDNGLYNVIERSPGPPPPMGNMGATAKTVTNTPAIPEQKIQIPAQVGPEQSVGSYVTREGGSPELTLDRIFELQKELGKYSKAAEANPIKTKEIQRLTSELDKNIQGLAEDSVEKRLAEQIKNGEIESLQDLNKKWANASGAGKDLKMQRNPITGEFELANKSFNKLQSNIRQEEAGTVAAVPAKRYIENLFGKLKAGGANENLMGLQNEANQVSSDIDLSRMVTGKSHFSPKTLLPVLNVQNVSKAANYTGRLLHASPSAIKNTANFLINSGDGKKLRVGKSFLELLNKDEQARNAMLFSLQQQPWARETLDQLFGKKDK